MKCQKCRRALDKGHMKNAVKLHTNGKYTGPPGTPNNGGAGPIKQIFHLRCFKAQERNDPELKARRGKDQAPSAYQASQNYGNAVDASEEARRKKAEAEARLEEIRALQSVIQGGGSVDEDERAHLGDLIGGSASEDGELDLEAALAKAEQDAVLAKRQAELEEDRASEDNRSGVDVADKGFADQRDPSTIDI